MCQIEFTSTPLTTAITQTEAATTAATFQLVLLVIVSSEGRLIAGPAISRAKAAPIGAPALSNTNAKGISKNVGSASGTANVATTITANNFALGDVNAFAGSHCAITIETRTPIIITGITRRATFTHERTKPSRYDRPDEYWGASSSHGTVVPPNILSAIMPIRRTAAMLATARVPAILY